MAMQTETGGQQAAVGQNWYSRSPDTVAAALDIDPEAGLSAATAAERLRADVVAAAVSLVIQEWSTAVLLFLLTVLNAVVGLRQQGKAESAMNALKSMMKASARVRRDGVESKIPAERRWRRRRSTASR